MKKLLSCILLAVMLLPAGAASIATQTIQTHTITTSLTFHTPLIKTADGFSLVTVDNTNSWLSESGAPSLPSYLHTYTFPLGTTITSVTVRLAPTQDYTLTAPLQNRKAPQTIIDHTLISAPTQNPNLASYPDPCWSYHLGAGLSAQNQHTLYLSLRVTPIQYHEDTRSISFSPSATVTIQYTDPSSHIFPLTSTNDLVIIAPENWTSALQPLADQKISHGISTIIVGRESICQNANYSSGRDCAERIKLYIKDCIEKWGTTSVLFVGGRAGGVMKEKWYMPVRYSHLDDDSAFEYSYLSDLYFSDIYDANLSFSSWDTNHNGIYGEWTNTSRDILDLYPDVNFGRLACTSLDEVTNIVTKITTYETGAAGADWFKTMVAVGGDSAPGDVYYEGEAENQAAIDYMPGFTPTKLWTSTGALTGRDDVIAAVSKGCGFLYFDGHGNPQVWSTHPPNNDSWVDGLFYKDMTKLTNGEKLPVVVCGGCHNGQFNTTLLAILKGVIQEGPRYFMRHFYYRDWSPECWAWKMMSVTNGGSIATMANTALDWFAEGDYNNNSIPDAVEFYSGFMNTHIFYNYGMQNMTQLGVVHTQALTTYLNTFSPINDKLDCKTVQEYELFGDPTLIIGGYE